MRKAVAAILALLCALLPLASSAQCLRSGTKVALLGSADDPDVFVWDSRYRLAVYQTGTYDAARALLPHAWVLHPGTRAVVVACAPGYVHPRFSAGTDDAVGIILLSGPYRGRSGWVTASDLRELHRR